MTDFRNVILLKGIAKRISLFVIMCLNIGTSSSQQIEINNSDHPYLYVSSALVSSKSLNHATIDLFHSKTDQPYLDYAVRVDVGIKFAKNTSFEVGYMKTYANHSSMLMVANDFIYKRGNGISTISYFSFVLAHKINLFKNRIFLSPALGYATGRYGELPAWEGTQSVVTNDYGHTIFTKTSKRQLHSGNAKFVVMKIGLDIALFRKLNLFSNVFLNKGMIDIHEEEKEYIINEHPGTFTSTSSGSIRGIEVGLRFNFR